MSKESARILSPEEIKIGMLVWVEAYTGGVKELVFHGIYPYGFLLVCVFSDGTEWRSNSYGYRWRCWSSRPSEEDRLTPWQGADYDI